MLFDRTVPSNSVIFGGTVLPNSTFVSDTFPKSSRAMGCDTFVVNISNVFKNKQDLVFSVKLHLAFSPYPFGPGGIKFYISWEPNFPVASK